MYELTLNVYLQNNDHVKQLEKERDEAIKRAEELKQKNDRLIMDMAHEQVVNLELVDLLKAHGVKFRKSADMRTWESAR